MTIDYTLISIIGIFIVAIALVGIVFITLYRFEKLKVNTNAKVNTNLESGKVESEFSVDLTGEIQDKNTKK